MARDVPVFTPAITGLVIARFTNVRMGITAHLEGVIDGIFLVALAVWSEVRLPAGAKVTAYLTVLYGTCVRWLRLCSRRSFGTAEIVAGILRHIMSGTGNAGRNAAASALQRFPVSKMKNLS